MRAAKPLSTALAAMALAALWAAPAQGAEPPSEPAWTITSIAAPTDFPPSGAGEPDYDVRLTDIGDAATDGSPVIIEDALPKGLTVASKEFTLRYKDAQPKDFGPEAEGVCADATVAEVTTVTCTIPEELPGSGEESALIYPGEELLLVIDVELPGTATEGDVLTNHVSVEGGGAPAAAASPQNEVSATPAPAGFAEFSAAMLGPDGNPVTQAGAHPFQLTTSFSLNTRHTQPGDEETTITTSGGDAKDTPVALPPGLIGNPTAVSRCPLKQFNSVHPYTPFPGAEFVLLELNECPNSSVVGYINLRRTNAPRLGGVPIYNLVPSPGMPAQFGFHILDLPIFIDTEVRPSENYKVVGVVRNITEAQRVVAGLVTLWGNPADPRHDPLRGNCLNEATGLFPVSIKTTVPATECGAGAPVKPFLRAPTSCASPLEFTMGVDTWTDQGEFAFSHAGAPAPVGCGLLDFDPTLRARPSTDVADSPSGLEVDLHIPQSEDPEGLGEADLRKAVVRLPEGLVANPSQANRLEGCSEAQAGFQRREADGTAVFDDEAAECPDGSKIGTVEVDTPLLDEPLHGGVYLASPHENPFGSLLAVYIAVQDPERGIVVKLAGRVDADPANGRLTTTFDQNPQVPFEDFKLHFFEGPLAPLRTPAVCGAHATTSQMTPWSAPESGPPATPSDSWAIARAPGGGPCPATAAAEPNAPSFQAGTVAPIAAAYSPLTMNLRREDGSQEFAGLTLTTPPGLLGRLAGIPYCPEADLAAAAARPGRGEQADPSCPAASALGSVEVGAGAGPSPYYAGGKVYLAGPYKGAPLSLAIITPAVAGPFDLGTVVVRTALYVNPVTAQITAVSDPIPHILQGIPLDVRSIAVRIDRPGFTLNPTSCDPFSFVGQELSTLGQAAPLSNRFQVGECARLGFKPQLGLRLKGKTRRGGFPKLRAVYTAREGDADLKRMVLRFPRSEFIEQGHFRTICTRVQYAAGAGGGQQCPAGSVYGHIRAFTPLLAQPLEGSVFLRSSSHNLPDVVFALHGQVDAEVAVRIDSAKGGLRASIEEAPDVPISKVVLDMQGGQRGLFVNSRDICRATNRATVELDAQNGKIFDSMPPLRNDCAGKPGRHRR